MMKTGSPNLPNNQLAVKRVEDVLSSKILTNNGPYVEKLEGAVREYLAVPYALAVSNPTIALQLAVDNLFDHALSFIIVPSFAPISLVHTIRHCGFQVGFVEVGEDYLMDIKYLKSALERWKNVGIAGIIPVNIFGDYCKIEELEEINLPKIYYSTQALGAFNDRGEKYIGNYGLCEIFSLSPNELITAGEGSIITATDRNKAAVLRTARNYDYVQNTRLFGTNARMSEIHAAVGLTNFENIQEIIKHNFNNYQLYKQLLPPGILMKEKCFFSNFSHIVVEVDPKVRDTMIALLIKNEIYVNNPIEPIHMSSLYFKDSCRLPLTERLSSSIIELPTGLSTFKKDIQYICKVLKENL